MNWIRKAITEKEVTKNVEEFLNAFKEGIDYLEQLHQKMDVDYNKEYKDIPNILYKAKRLYKENYNFYTEYPTGLSPVEEYRKYPKGNY